MQSAVDRFVLSAVPPPDLSEEQWRDVRSLAEHLVAAAELHARLKPTLVHAQLRDAGGGTLDFDLSGNGADVKQMAQDAEALIRCCGDREAWDRYVEEGPAA